MVILLKQNSQLPLLDSGSHLHPHLGLSDVPGVGEEGGVGVVGGHGVGHGGQGGVVLTAASCPVRGRVGAVTGVAAGEGGRRRQGVVVVGGRHRVGVGVVRVLPAAHSAVSNLCGVRSI